MPTRRHDGYCTSCGRERAVTVDGLYCRRCLKEVVRGLSPDLPKSRSESYGRSARASRVLGGAPDMDATEDRD